MPPKKSIAVETDSKPTQVIKKDELNEDELSKERSKIASIKSNIETLEKTFKESLLLRRHTQDPGLVFNEENNLYEADQGQIDILKRAKDEIARLKQLRKSLEDQKEAKETENGHLLDQRIQETRRKYQYKADIISNGPKFQRHFFSMFGDILNVQALSDHVFLVVTSTNFFEIWYVNYADEDKIEIADAFLKDVIQKPEISDIVSTCHLTNEFCIKPPPLPRVSNDQDDPKQEQETSSSPDDEFRLLTRAYMKTLYENEKQRTPDEDEIVAPHSTHTFAIGSSDGHVRVIKIQINYNHDFHFENYTLEITHQKKVSDAAIGLLSFMDHNQNLVTLMEKNNNQVIVGMNLDLQTLWTIPLSHIQLTAQDRRRRIIENNLEIPFSTETFSDCKPRVIQSDPILKSILVALISGVIVRIILNESEDSNAMPKNLTLLWVCDTREWNLDANKSNDEEKEPENQSCTENIKIISLKSFKNRNSRRAKLIVCCSDGTIRSYANEQRLTITCFSLYKQVEDELKETFTSIITEDATKTPKATLISCDILELTDPQLILSYGNDGMLYTYDVNKPVALVEMRILSSRIASANLSVCNSERCINIFSPDLTILSSKREWSLMNLSSLFKFLGNKNQ